uniref:Cytochrome c oxidase subunit 2 n=2 Tax=Teredorus TaxID=215049 RepID=A0A7G7WR24_9ORTH|nr:cytochrome c oxidase subunit II [Teredorus bashanensis]YP_010697725.1 cytochrome c oxidase subunit II [Teredorus anhuiensis]QNH69001.1 cytochrome c oxidase subunit II [Teredorus nigropennis]UPH84306.1 cytochrome c oxidase subunit II [Teredorus bashanensis]WCF76523.1 cytochrome c oxidase subunit II [Teredorus anhuiensis]
MATWNNMSFQDSMSPLMEQLTFFHDHTMSVITLITLMVSYMMTQMVKNRKSFRYLMSEHLIETIWTMMPAVVLIFIALPSLHLLYMIDDNEETSITIKTIGRQWYWSYEYSDFQKIEFDSFMITEPMNKNSFRLLDVDNRTILPINTSIRILTSASDVLHSWTIPNLGIKIDATPGRLNQGEFMIKRPGLMFGQCSEICGINHSFMPITIEAINIQSFIKWIKNTI